MDVEGGCGVSGYDGVRIFESPFQPDVEKMPLDPSVAVLRVFEELQLVDLDGCLAGLAVGISS